MNVTLSSFSSCTHTPWKISNQGHGYAVGDTFWSSNFGAINIFSGVWQMGQRLFHFKAKYINPGTKPRRNKTIKMPMFQLCSESTFLLQLGQCFIVIEIWNLPAHLNILVCTMAIINRYFFYLEISWNLDIWTFWKKLFDEVYLTHKFVLQISYI